MVLARWEKPIQDDAGNLITGLTVEVRDENTLGNPLATGLCSDRDGVVTLGNPFSAPTGVVAFHAPGGCYSVRAYKTGVDQTFRFQPVGTAQERDIVEGTGNVSGPDDSADGEIAVFDGTDGKKIKRGGTLGPLISGATAKAVPVDADMIGLADSAASNILKKMTFANLATWVGTKMGPLITAATGKTTPVNADELVIADSAASSATKKVTLTNFKAFLKAYFDTVYVGPTLLTEQATTSGTTKDFTIPAGAKRITVMINGVSTANNANKVGVQLGDSGGIETTVYLGDDFDRFTMSVPAGGTGATDALYGAMTLTRMNGTHTWVCTSTTYNSAAGTTQTKCGLKATSAELTTVRLMGGTFDAGSVNVMWE